MRASNEQTDSRTSRKLLSLLKPIPELRESFCTYFALISLVSLSFFRRSILFRPPLWPEEVTAEPPYRLQILHFNIKVNVKVEFILLLASEDTISVKDRSIIFPLLRIYVFAVLWFSNSGFPQLLSIICLNNLRCSPVSTNGSMPRSRRSSTYFLYIPTDASIHWLSSDGISRQFS